MHPSESTPSARSLLQGLELRLAYLDKILESLRLAQPEGGPSEAFEDVRDLVLVTLTRLRDRQQLEAALTRQTLLQASESAPVEGDPLPWIEEAVPERALTLP